MTEFQFFVVAIVVTLLTCAAHGHGYRKGMAARQEGNMVMIAVSKCAHPASAENVEDVKMFDGHHELVGKCGDCGAVIIRLRDSPPRSPPPVTIEELADATTRLLGICALSTLPPGARAYLAEVAALLARVRGAK